MVSSVGKTVISAACRTMDPGLLPHRDGRACMRRIVAWIAPAAGMPVPGFAGPLMENDPADSLVELA